MKRTGENIILFGYPRSGTTWICEILASSGELTYLHEPDNERINISGLLAKGGGPRFVIDDKASSSVLDIFNRALRGEFLAHSSDLSKYPLKLVNYSTEYLEGFIDHPERIRTLKNKLKLSFLKATFNIYKVTGLAKQPGPYLIKSVHSGLMLETLMQELKFTPIISIRHPAAVLKSMKTLNNKDAYRSMELIKEIDHIIPKKYVDKFPDLKTTLEKQALQIGIHHFYWKKFVEERDVLLLKHEDFLKDAKSKFQEVFEILGLHFNSHVEEMIDHKNKKGSGYKTTRSSEDLIDVWKKGFSQSELDEIKRGYTLLPNNWYTDFSL